MSIMITVKSYNYEFDCNGNFFPNGSFNRYTSSVNPIGNYFPNNTFNICTLSLNHIVYLLDKASLISYLSYQNIYEARGYGMETTPKCFQAVSKNC
jgi:hypothetical protein